MHIGKRIKQLMEGNEKFTPIGLALALGKKNKQTYYDMIKREDINTADLIATAKYFKVPITEFFDKGLRSSSTLFIEERVAILEEKIEKLMEKHISL